MLSWIFEQEAEKIQTNGDKLRIIDVDQIRFMSVIEIQQIYDFGY